MADEKKTLSARVNPIAHNGWLATSRVYGATATTLAEVIGEELAQLDAPLPRLPRHWRVWLKEAERREQENRANQGVGGPNWTRGVVIRAGGLLPCRLPA